MKAPIKLVVLLAAVLGLVGTSIASASGTPMFEAEEYPVEVEGVTHNDQGFQITGAVSVCKRAVFKTGSSIPGAPNPTGPATTLEIHPIYEECSVELGGTFKAKVTTTGCNYEFVAAEPGTKAGSVNLVCEAGKEIEVTVEEISGCTIKIPGQNGLKTIEYVNQGSEKGRFVEVNAEVSGIEWSTTAGCKLPSSGTNGEYRLGRINEKGEPELAATGNPAKGIAEGFNEFGEKEGIWVEN